MCQISIFFSPTTFDCLLLHLQSHYCRNCFTVTKLNNLKCKVLKHIILLFKKKYKANNIATVCISTVLHSVKPPVEFVL